MSKRAVIYARISRDAEQEGLGVARQQQDCRAFVKRHGWTLVEPPYVDNDISASTKSRKPRPAYDAMLAAARAGDIDVIVAYSNSRLTRRPLELEDLIALSEQTGVAFHTVVSGSDDLATADGRMIARIKASVDAGEAERIAERLRRRFLEKAQNGTAGQGSRPFGWADDKVTLHPTEAPLVRKAVQDVIDGVPTREVARQWNAAGATTVRGRAWDHSNVRAVLRNPRLAGWRVHQRAEKAKAARRAGQTLAWTDLVARDAAGEMVKGEWTPMVDQDTFDALQGALDGASPRTRRGSRRYLLTGVARCGVCGSRMYGTRTPKGHAYTCDAEGGDHTLTIAGVQTDALLVALVEARLRQVDLTAEPSAPQEWPGEARLRAIPKQIKELMEAYQGGVLSGALVFPQVQALEAEQARLERERPRSAPVPSVADPEAFLTLDVDRQRAVVEALVEAVVVGKAERRGQPWTPERLEVVWRGARVAHDTDDEALEMLDATDPEEAAELRALRQAKQRARGEIN